MYYKIENKNSEVYKKLHAMRKREITIEKENKKIIKELTDGLEWDEYIGHSGQQTFGRVTNYVGFRFKEPEKVDLNLWRRHKDHKDFFIPNKKTKAGKQLNQSLFLLESSSFYRVYEILEVESVYGRFTFPYVEICDSESIVIYLDDRQIPKDKNVIEITSVEAKRLLAVDKE